MGKGSTTVEAADPYEIARADAEFNRINQFTPFGSLTFSGPNRNTANLSLNPAVQDLANRQLLSDRMLMDTALSRQADIQGRGLPSLTTGLNTQGLPGLTPYTPAIGGGSIPIRDFSGGFDSPINPPGVPDSVGRYQVGQPGTISTYTQRPGDNATGGTVGFNPQQSLQKPMPGSGMAPPPSAGGFSGGGPTAGPIPTLNALPGAPGATTAADQTLGPADFETARGDVEQAFFDRSASLLDRKFGQQEDALKQSLANRGLLGTSGEIGEAADTELGNFNQMRGETFSNLARDAVLAGGQEQSRLFDMDRARGLFELGAQGQSFGQQLAGQDFNRQNALSMFDAANQSRQTGMQDIAFANQVADQIGQRDLQAQMQQANLAQSNRATQFNELAALLGLQQVAQPGLNNFFTPGQADVTGGFGLNQQAQMANARNNAGIQSGVLGGLFGLGSAAMGNPGGVPGAFGK